MMHEDIAVKHRTRMNRHLPLCALACAVCLVCHYATAAIPYVDYRTITTEHFYIYYHEGTEVIARRVAEMCEQVHDTLVPVMGWEPLERTHVLLRDTTESANGSASVRPRARMTLHMVPPGSFDNLGNYADHLRILITHEYTHILHLQTHDGVSRVINSVFGPTYFPNQVQPTWFIEGMAVLNETKFSSAGRLRGATFEMYIRTNVLEDTFFSLDQMSSGINYWPKGHVPYLYGAFFLSYIAERFGHDKLVEISHEYGSELLPYGLNKIAKRVLGHTFVDLYYDWKRDLTEKYEKQAQRLRDRGLTQSTPVTFKGMHTSRPRYSADGKYIYFTFNDGYEIRGLWRVDRKSGKTEKLRFVENEYNLSPDPAGRYFYYSTTAPYRTYFMFNDLFRFDPRTGKSTRLTYGFRAAEPEVSQDGRSILFRRIRSETGDLMMSDIDGRNISLMVASPGRHIVDSYAWSPDGRELAYSIFSPGGYYSICRMSRGKESLDCILREKSLNTKPSYDPSGRYLLFTSDRTGIFNIYAWDLRERKLWQVTNVLNGAQYPAVSPEGTQIAFRHYSSTGWDIHTMRFDPSSWLECEQPREQPEPLPDPPPVPMVDRPYDPAATVLPRRWELDYKTGILGPGLKLNVSAGDIVSHHIFGASVLFGLTEFEAVGGLAYQYHKIRPHLSVSFSRSMGTGTYKEAGEEKEYVLIRHSVTANTTFRHRILHYPQNFTLGYKFSAPRPRDPIHVEADPSAPRPHLPSFGLRSGVRFSWSLGRAQGTALGISPESGRTIRATFNFDDPVMGSAVRALDLSYSWIEFIGIPWFNHHVLVLKYSGGIGYSGGDDIFAIGGYADMDIINAIINNLGMGARSLRGYPPGVMHGDQYHVLQVEYQFPIVDIYTGYETLPLYIRRLQGGIFTDTGTAIRDSFDPEDLRTGLGAELLLSFTVGYHQTQFLKFSYAYGFMEKGNHSYHLTLGGAL